MTLPNHRPGIGDDTGRRVDDPAGRGYLEWRWAPAYGVEIVNVEVDNDCRRQGVGRSLLGLLAAKLNGEAKTVYAFSRLDNLIARDWYLGCGFTPAALIRSFYGDEISDDAALYTIKVKVREGE